MNSAEKNKKKISEYTFEDIKIFFSDNLKKISSAIILIEIGNDFNSFTSSNATNFTSEIEVTGTGSISYSSSLLNITTGYDTTTQQKLNNGITLQGNTVVQNCEWSQSSYACGNRGVGQDSYSTKIQILDDNGSVLSETNQIRNNDAGYNANAYKYSLPPAQALAPTESALIT